VSSFQRDLDCSGATPGPVSTVRSSSAASKTVDSRLPQTGMAIFITDLCEALCQFLCQKREVERINNKSGIIDGWNVDGRMVEKQGRNNETIK
jgi:hypothetical protein